MVSDPDLLDELLRLCGAAGTPPVVATDPAALARAWPAASVVLISAELASAVAGLPRRRRVIVVGAAADPLWDVAVDVGADHVAVLPSAGGWLVGLLSAPAIAAAEPCPVLCVIGGQGGGGATTLAIALSRCASATGIETLLIDADPFGGGVDLALGMESASGDRWSQLLGPAIGVQETAGFLDRLPSRQGLRLLASDRDNPELVSDAAMSAALTVARSRCGLVVVDLPRSLDPASRVALAAAGCVYVVVPAQVRAVAAAAQLITALRGPAREIQAVVRGPAPSGLSLDAITRSLGVPLAGAVRAEPNITRDYERGVPPGQPRGPLKRLCAELLGRRDDLRATPEVAA